MSTVRTRIAPSPTGEDLHIGNVYTALLNFAYARKNNGQFIVRIEDTDRTRLVPGSEQRILSSLSWFGLNPDESPQKPGPFGPYRQSERLPIYKKYALKLVDEGHAYYCFCTPERLSEMRADQQKKGAPPMYDGFCKKLTGEEVAIKLDKNEQHVIRLNVPDEGVTQFTDMIRGNISFENKLIDDQVLIKSDGYPTYHLGVVIDDHLMEISHIIRAEEWISSTPKHILLYNFFRWELPVFAHGPILRNPDKSKLSKRKNPVWASWYRRNGFLPHAILNYLSLMGWSPPETGKKDSEIFSLEEFIRNFSLSDIKPVGPAFDVKKLEWLNGEYIRSMDNDILKEKLVEFVGPEYSSDIITKTIPLVKERIKKLSDYLPISEFYFHPPEKYETDAKDNKPMIRKLIPELTGLSEWKAGIIGTAMQKLVSKEQYKSSEFFMAIRIGITGKKISPPLNESMELLGKDEVIRRLEKFT